MLKPMATKMYPIEPLHWFMVFLFGPGMQLNILSHSPSLIGAIHLAEIYVQSKPGDQFIPLGGDWPLRAAWKSRNGGLAVYVVLDDREPIHNLSTVEMIHALKLVRRPSHKLIELMAALPLEITTLDGSLRPDPRQDSLPDILSRY